MASVELYRGEPGPTIRCLEHTTAGGFKAGDLVKLSSGYVAIGTAGAFVGIAHTDASGTAGTAIDVELINPNSTYKCAYHTDTTAQTLVGDLLDFTFTAGAHTLEESGATTDVYCVGLIDAAGTASGKLEVRFLSSVLTATT